MRIERHFTKAGASTYEGIRFHHVASEIRNPDGSVVFRNGRVEVPEQWSQVAWLRDSLGDLQLAAAIETLRARLAGGDWIAVGDDSSAITVADDELRNQLEFRRRILRELEAVEARIARLEGRAARDSESGDDAAETP